MLTAKQKELLLFIHQRVSDTGVPPSFDEMKEALDLKSKSGIHRLITALEERGFIRRLPHRARALEILKLPEGVSADNSSKKAGSFEPAVIDGGKKERNVKAPAPKSQAANTLDVPVMGRIAAGVPIEAIQDHSQDITVPVDMLGSGEHYALEVRGDSMIDAGIFEGDTVLIQRSSTALNGDIVVALVDDEEATLKTFRKGGGKIALEAANPAFETREFGPGRVKVQGKLVGLIRRY